ncbi:MAG: trimethylamine methyltransferase family protein [Candidatus Latescibacteria bacterium]|jgi:trimethylamine--corrinoid protein Co-methyltransferase|nr:trimethylamine methyltransferase family protein [Candidatus Latescibacterota bacterium]
MRTNQTDCATTQFRVLSDSQIERIVLGALEVLDRTGTRVVEPGARRLLDEAGAAVDGDIVRIPPGLVKASLNTVPPRIAVGSRDGAPALHLEGDRIHYGTGSDCPFIIDAETGARREFVKHDTANAARVLDACPNLDFHMSLGLTSDVPTYSYDRHQAAAMLRNTLKPLVLTAMSREALSDILEMYIIVRGSRDAFETNPGFVVYLEPTTPLVHSKASMEKLIFAAERRIPAIYTPGAIAGATCPVTMAGAMVVSLAEFFTGMVVAQLQRPGAAVIMGGVVSPMDMRTTTFTYGSPELHLMSAAMTDIAHHLEIPMFSTAGCSDSKTLDEQAAVEAAMSILSAGLSGANLIHDVGFLESALIGSFEMVVLSDEIVGMAKRFLSGVRVDEEALALDVIHEVGPGGNYLANEHTAHNMRRELWFPKLMDRTKYAAWEAEGSKTLGDRVRDRVREILESHEVPPLPDEVESGIDEILAEGDKRAAEEQTKLL